MGEVSCYLKSQLRVRGKNEVVIGIPVEMRHRHRLSLRGFSLCVRPNDLNSDEQSTSSRGVRWVEG